MSINMALCIAFSLINNISLIQKKEVSIYVVISAIAISVLAGVSYGFFALQLLIAQSIFNILQLIIISFIIFTLIPFLHALKLNPYGCDGVLQDGFLFGTMATINPIITIQLVNSFSNWISSEMKENNYLWNVLALIISYYLLLVPVVDYCIKNNVEHCKKKRKICLEGIKEISNKDEKLQEEERYRNLKTFLTIQNMITIMMGIPYSFIYLGICYIKKYNRKTNNITMFPNDNIENE